MTGFSSRVRDAINRATQTYASATVSERGLSKLIDPTMTGTARFMQKSGYPFALLTPQMTATLAADAAAGTRTAIINGQRLLTWLRPGLVISFELLEDVTLSSFVDNGDGTVTVSLEDNLVSSHEAGVSVSIRAFPVVPMDSYASGMGTSLTGDVRLQAPFLIVQGDEIRHFGKRYTVSRAVEDGVTANGYEFLVQVTADGFPALTTADDLFVTAKPAYRSEILTVPQYNAARVQIQGPVVVDWVSGPMVADYLPDPESLCFIEEYDASNRVLVASRQVQKNDTLGRFPILRDQFLFWTYAEGGCNWDGTYTLLKAFDSGRVHAWTPCRPPLDPAPLSTVERTVPTFSPYQVLLSPRIIAASVVVREKLTGALVPSTDYVVDDVAGTLAFIAGRSGTQVVVSYRPRIEWQFQAIPDQAGLELVVTCGREPKQVYPLGAANVPVTCTVRVNTDAEVDQLHLTVRRTDDAAGAFTVKMTDWTQRGGQTAAIRYTLLTGAEQDYDWCSSGLLLKALWPTIELLRARLDGESLLARYLDNGRVLG